MNRVGCLTLLIALATGCGAPPAAKRNVVVTGSRELAPLVREIGKRFEALHPDVRLNVQPTSSDRTVEETRQGLADVGMMARPLRPSEVGLTAYPLARDGIALVVNKSNPTSGLKTEQVASLYTRYLTSWKQVGGPERPVVLVDLEEGHAVRELFRQHFGIRTNTARADQVVATAEDVLRVVGKLPGALGYAPLGRAVTAAAGQPIRLLKLDGVPATRATVAAGRYGLVRPLQLLLRPGALELAGEFVEYARSPTVHDLIELQGYVLPKR